MSLGAELAEQGAQRAADHADRVIGDWSDRAYAFFKQFAARGLPFKTEQVREYAESCNLEPAPDPRAWGNIAKRAVRENIIHKIGVVASDKASSHAGFVALWVRW